MPIRRILTSLTPSRHRVQAAASHHGPASQQGFTLIELSIVAGVVLILSILAIPAVSGYVTENKVPKVASELQRFVARTKANAEGGGATPYVGINNLNNLSKALRDSSIVTVNETSGLVVHRLGGSGSGSSGVITVTPATLGGGALGNAFALSLTDVNDKACPGLSTVMQMSAEQIEVNGTVIKTLGDDNESGTYNAVAAESECTPGDSNTFVFTTR